MATAASAGRVQLSGIHEPGDRDPGEGRDPGEQVEHAAHTRPLATEAQRVQPVQRDGADPGLPVVEVGEETTRHEGDRAGQHDDVAR